nr:hypothetical protein [Tanacetum cinerariifolium]
MTMKVDEKKLEYIPVVRNFPGVFPEDLSGLPPSREVEFRRDLISGAMHVAKSPYRLAPTKIQELSSKTKVSYDLVLHIGELQYCLLRRKMVRYSKEEHEVHLKLILELLKKEKLFRNFSKCEFRLQEVRFLRHVVNSEGIHVDTSKIKAVKNWKPPKTPTEICSFLRLARYYKRFITNFSKNAKPLTPLTQKDNKFDWGDEQENAFQTLKDMLCDAPILAFPEGADVKTINF